MELLCFKWLFCLFRCRTTVNKEDNAFSYGEGKQLQNSIFSYFVSIYL